MNIKSFFKGEERTVKAKKNIIASVVFKGIDAITYLLLVPVTLGYLNPYEYGIWLTLSSILMWINSFDIGLGNGMRNKLAKALAHDDNDLGRIYVSTTFYMLVVLMGGLIVLGTIINPFINWYGILNTTEAHIPHLSEIVYVSFFIFCLNFIFKFIGNVYLALQLPAINNLLIVLGHVLSLLVIYILTLITSGNLLWVAIAYSASPLIVYLLAYPVTFIKIYPYLKPSIRLFKIHYLKDLFNLGVQFFILQLSGVILFSFANIIISHLFGPEDVTPYNIAYRYFSVVLMLMNLVLAPMWSATTDAYAKGDYGWIRSVMHTIRKVLYFISFCVVLMVFLSEFVYRIWIGDEVKIPLIISALMGLYVLILIWSLTYSNILNGLGKLKIQTINTLVVSLCFIPFCYFLGLEFGIVGILISMCILNSSGLILNKLQFDRILSRRAYGIWNK